MQKTGNKVILRESDVRSRVMDTVERVALPVIETIGPRGKNVLYEDSGGNPTLTNDGKTIIDSINFKDPLENAVANIMKDGAARTNQMAGDATSTTTLYGYVLTKFAAALKKKGMTQRAVRDLLQRVQDKLLKRLEAQKKVVNTKAIEFEIAKISANNDESIAKLTQETVDVAGIDGMVFIEMNNGEETTIEKQTGFRVPNGMIFQNLYNDLGRPVAKYDNVKVLIFDKQLYYAEECEHIVRVANDLGYGKLVIVAKNFVGDAPNTFIANHVQGVIKLVLTKCEDDTQLEDLAVYLGGTVISETAGRRVDSLHMGDFMDAESVYADPMKVLLKGTTASKALKSRIAGIKEELEKDKNDRKLKDRLASLTNGIVTVKVGGRTHTEARERVFRFEDAISAVRAAKEHGFLVGGGLSMYNAYVAKDYPNRDENEAALLITRASIEQLAENSMVELNYDKLTKDIGLNALTGEYENLFKAGVVEPYKAVEMSLKNAVSVADIITSIGSFILNDYDKEESAETGKRQ